MIYIYNRGTHGKERRAGREMVFFKLDVEEIDYPEVRIPKSRVKSNHKMEFEISKHRNR